MEVGGIMWEKGTRRRRRGVEGSSGDLPQQHAVNQSDLGRTGTHLVTAPRQHCHGGEEKRCAWPASHWSIKRWIDGSRMKRERWAIVSGRGMAAGVWGVVEKTTINGVMWVELKERERIDSFLSEGGNEWMNVHLLYVKGCFYAEIYWMELMEWIVLAITRESGKPDERWKWWAIS